MANEKLSFNDLKEWFLNAPDLGKESFPKADSLIETYQQWLMKHPQGYVC
jgi:hypothetical protein